MLTNHPKVLNTIACVTSIATELKWICVVERLFTQKNSITLTFSFIFTNLVKIKTIETVSYFLNR